MPSESRLLLVDTNQSPMLTDGLTCGRRSLAMTTPVLRMSCAMYVLFPPGAADMSSTRSPWYIGRLVGGGGDMVAKRGGTV